MTIIIQPSGDVPIYEQIIQQIQRAISSGELQRGDALPSIRVLAKDLRVSVITTKRAYEELERLGLIESSAGRGTFVRADRNVQQAARQQHLRECDEHLEKATRSARACGLARGQLLERLGKMYDGEDQNGADGI